jgi:hypothetical protein
VPVLPLGIGNGYRRTLPFREKWPLRSGNDCDLRAANDDESYANAALLPEFLMLRSRPARALAIAVVVTVPMLYALAAGPLVYMRAIGRPLISLEVCQWIYHPLIRAEARIPPLGHAMHLYVGWWERAAERRLNSRR